MMHRHDRLRPQGPRLLSSLSSPPAPSAAVKAGVPLQEVRRSESGNDLYLFLGVTLIFFISFAAATLAPTIMMAGSNDHSTIGRSFSLGGFFLAIFSVGAATFSPGGLETNGTLLVILLLSGFGFMIGGIIGDTVRLW